MNWCTTSTTRWGKRRTTGRTWVSHFCLVLHYSLVGFICFQWAQLGFLKCLIVLWLGFNFQWILCLFCLVYISCLRCLSVVSTDFKASRPKLKVELNNLISFGRPQQWSQSLSTVGPSCFGLFLLEFKYFQSVRVFRIWPNGRTGGGAFPRTLSKRRRRGRWWSSWCQEKC